MNDNIIKEESNQSPSSSRYIKQVMQHGNNKTYCAR